LIFVSSSCEIWACQERPQFPQGASTEEPVRQGSLFGAPPAEPAVQQGLLSWTEAAGRTAWFLFDVAADKILDEATAMLELIRCRPETPRRRVLEQNTLKEIRAKVEKHIDRSYLKSLQAPQGVKPILKAWMELN
jgi:hypothetical protein